MTEIRYTLLAEGWAEEGCIPQLAAQLEPRFRWVKSKFQLIGKSKRNKAGKSRVIGRLPSVAEASLLQNREDLILAGIDLDQPDYTLEDAWKHASDMLRSQISHRVQPERVVIFIPVQAIDYWMLYLHDPSMAANSAESWDKDRVKKAVYGRNQDGTSVKRRAAELASQEDAAAVLIKKSKSFSAFASALRSGVRSIDR
ncbi:MAG: hypothetical protein NW241_08235 [Bacteroidia bacterium]|nr:hypothetical protein [Bacteroidia bacterium]